MSKLEETLAKMEEIANDVKEFAAKKMEGQDEEKKAKVQALVDKTAEVIKQTTVKVSEAAQSAKDDEQLNAFLNKVIVKVQEASDFTKMKISEILPEKEKLEDFEREISENFDKFVESESVQTVIKGFQSLSEQINNYFQRPEVQARVNKCKKVTLAAAEKGMEQLRKVLEVKEEDEVKDAKVEKIIIEDTEEPKED